MATAATPFAQAARDEVAARSGLAAEVFKVDAPPNLALGDFAVACFPAAKAMGLAPPAVAAKIAAEFVPNEWLASATAAGPFVNFKANRDRAFRWVIEQARLGALLPKVGQGQTICIDYSSPNISKHLAYHHIRSTVIGHSLAQIFRGLGYRVIGINHLGDWGTNHGMLIAAWKLWGGGAGGANDSAALEALTVDELNELYVRFRNEIKTDKAVEAEGRDWWKKLEAGDAEARRLWQRFRDVSWAEFESAYEMLGIRFDEVRGESAYEADMPRVIEELGKKNLTSISDGALVVELAGEKTPILLRTTDGTSLYATRDVATAEYRWNTYHFTRSLYVVDRGQSLHFKQLFKLLALAGHEWASKCEHIPFGLVRIGGKKTGTRTGNVLLLKEVFAEAVEDIADRMASSDTRRADGGGSGHTVSADDLQATARMVGIGAVVFGTLVTQRDKDVDFDWEKVLSMDGDSGPYLQYSHARCASIRRKGGGENVSGASLAALQTDAEWSVARKLLDFGDIVVRASQSCEPHLVCHYLLDLAGEFSRWYTAGNGDASLRVLCEDADTRAARLALVAAVQDALAQGLSLLGLGAPQAM